MGSSEVTAGTDEDSFDDRWQGAVIDFDHWHFHRRLFERYEIVLAPGEFSKIVAEIRKGEALVLQAKKGRPSIYLARVESAQRSIFVLASREGRLFTALPPGAKLYRLKKAAKAKAKRQAAGKV